MKKTYALVLAILWCGISSFAANADRLNSSDTCKRTVQSRLHAVDVARYDKVSRTDKGFVGRLLVYFGQTVTSVNTPQYSGLLDEQRLHLMAEESQKERLDKVECTQSPTGQPYSLQEFTFEEHGWPVSRVNSLWDASTEKYAPVETYGFAWNDKGYCSSQWQTSELYGAGERRDYKYNDKNLGIEQVIYTYNPDEEQKWTPSSKGEYVYDDRGNIVEETLYQYDANEETWKYSTKNKAAWDEHGFQTLFEPYYWNGSEWVGKDERQEYSWVDKDHMTQCKSYTWQNGQWVYYVNLEQDFDKKLNLLRREKRFYNAEADNWNGCCTWNGSYYENEKSLSTYDDRGRVLTERSYGMPSVSGEWVLGAWANHKWTDQSDDGYHDDYVGYLGDETDYTESYAGIERFDAEGRQTYVLDKMYDYTQKKLLNDYERATTYNANGDVLTELTYSFDKDESNTRKGELSVENTYDGNNNIVETVNKNGGSGSIPMGVPSSDNVADDGIDWQNSTKFEYFYENDTVRVKKLRSRWQNGQWVQNQGEVVSYDYEVLVENLLAWPGLNASHKILQTQSLIPGSTDDWYVYDYFYSDAIISGIESSGNIQGVNVRVWPTVVSEGFNIEAPTEVLVKVYSMNGTCVLSSTSKWISATGLLPGMYVVDVNGTKTKIVKK